MKRAKKETRFSRYLKELRRRKGVSSRKAAAGMGLSCAQICHLETGYVSSPSVQTLAKIGKFYGVRVSFLCNVILDAGE